MRTMVMKEEMIVGEVGDDNKGYDRRGEQLIGEMMHDLG